MSTNEPKNALTPVNESIWRWDGTDADHGFPIVGYVLQTEGGPVLLDPPGTSGEAEEIRRTCGEPQGIVVTSRWHVRGAPRWAQAFGIPIAAPESAREELTAEGGRLDRVIGDNEAVYGWTALQFRSETESYLLDELALWHEPSRTVIVSDLLMAKEEGRIGLSHHEFGGVPLEQLRPFVEQLIALQPQLILSCHVSPRPDMMERLRRLLHEYPA